MRWFNVVWFPTLSAFGLGACLPELDPSPLSDQAVVVFGSFDADPDALPGVLARMDEELGSLDLDAGWRKRIFDVAELDAEALAGLTVPDGIDTGEQMRMSMAAISPHDIRSHIALQTQRNLTCVNADSVVCHERSPRDEDQDAACLIDGNCETYRTDNVLRIESTLDFWIDAPTDLRRVTLDDGRQALVVRTWNEASFLNDNGERSWDQRFGLDLFIEDPTDSGRTRRYYATWLGPYVDGIQGGYLQDALRSGLQEGFENPDAQIAEPGCEIELETCLADSPF